MPAQHEGYKAHRHTQGRERHDTSVQRAAHRASVGHRLCSANRVVALTLIDADRSITYKARLPWSTGDLAVVTFCDASFAGEAGHKSQRVRIHYLTSAKAASDPNVTHHDMHLVAFNSSSTMKRVCRTTLQCEAYSLQHAAEHGDRIRDALLELLGELPMSPN